jgi:hypothetical protein
VNSTQITYGFWLVAFPMDTHIRIDRWYVNDTINVQQYYWSLDFLLLASCFINYVSSQSLRLLRRRSEVGAPSPSTDSVDAVKYVGDFVI